MKKQMLAFIITISLLTGAIGTTWSARVHSTRPPVGQIGQNCGFSLNLTTQTKTALTGCAETSYGWPAKYLQSGLYEILDNYHTTTPDQPQELASAIVSSEIHAWPLIADWLIWSAAGFVIISGITILNRSKNRTKAASPRA